MCNFNPSDFSLFTLIGVSESEKDSTNKSYSFEFSLKQNKIIEYNEENEDENYIKVDSNDDIDFNIYHTSPINLIFNDNFQEMNIPGL